jgi:hypothetical protein
VLSHKRVTASLKLLAIKKWSNFWLHLCYILCELYHRQCTSSICNAHFHPCCMTPELHCPLLPRTCLYESHLSRCEPEEHLVPDTNLEARIQLNVHRKPDEEVYDIERKERVPSLFAVRGDHAIVTAEIACGDAIHLKLELTIHNTVRTVYGH